MEDTGGCPNCELNDILLWSVHGALCDHYMTSVDVGLVVWLRFPAHVIFEPFGRS